MAKDELRVRKWSEFIGQTMLKDRLDLHIEAALIQNRSMEHVLLSGSPGFGKTSLAGIIASRMGLKLYEFKMPITERTLAMAVYDADGVLFLDEIHLASTKEQEAIQPLLEFGYMQDRKGRRTYPPDDKGITVVGATTAPEKLAEPLRERFSIKPDFDDYTDIEMAKICAGMARKANVVLSSGDCAILGMAAGGTPRGLRSFVLTARDIAVKTGMVAASDVLRVCRIAPDGLSKTHQEYLHLLHRNQGIAGLKTLQTHLRVNEGAIRELERLLVRKELIACTDRGRELTPQGNARIRGDKV